MSTSHPVPGLAACQQAQSRHGFVPAPSEAPIPETIKTILSRQAST